jgi:tetratricopeptide (TPR) repeat protein
MGVRGSATWASAIFVLALGTTAWAKPDAKRRFDQGLAHYQRHEYTAAAESFFGAYRASPTADALYNAGLAWELAGDAASAATAYEIAGGLDLPPKALDDTQKRLARLASALGRVEVSAPEGATLEAEPFEVRAAKAVFYFDPGSHSVKVTLRGGRRIEKRFAARAGETTVVLVETPTAAEDESSDAGEPETPSHPPRDKGSSATPWTTIGWVSVGVAGVASVAAIYFGVETLHARDRYNDTHLKDADARDRAEKYMHLTNIAWATAAVTGAAGAGILLFAPSETPGGAATLSPRIVVQGRF